MPATDFMRRHKTWGAIFRGLALIAMTYGALSCDGGGKPAPLGDGKKPTPTPRPLSTPALSGGTPGGGFPSGGSPAATPTPDTTPTYPIGGVPAGGNISGGTIAGGNVSGGSIAGGNISGGSIAGGNVSGGSIAGGNISGGSIAGGNVSGGSIAGGNIAGGSIAGGGISGGSISGGGVPPGQRTPTPLPTTPGGGLPPTLPPLQNGETARVMAALTAQGQVAYSITLPQGQTATEISYETQDVTASNLTGTTSFTVPFQPDFSIKFKVGVKSCQSVSKKVGLSPVVFSSLANGGITCTP